MATRTAFDAKTRFGELLERVAAGEEIVITRHDRPVARMVPEGGRSLEQIREAVAALRRLQAEISKSVPAKPKLSWADFKTFIKEGRE